MTRDRIFIRIFHALMISSLILACSEDINDTSQETVNDRTSIPEDRTAPESDAQFRDSDVLKLDEDILETGEPNQESDIRDSLDETISFTGFTSTWVGKGPATDTTVCIFGSDNCTKVSETGSFTLTDIPVNSEVMFLFSGGPGLMSMAFPHVTTDEDTVGNRVFVLVERAAVDFLISQAGENGFDIDKAIFNFFVGIENFPAGRGIPDVTLTYDGPENDKSPVFLVPTAEAPGATVDLEQTASSVLGQFFVPNLTPGDYTYTLNMEDRMCSTSWGWPVDGDGEPPHSYRTKLLPGYATFVAIRCKTTQTVNAEFKVMDVVEKSPIADVEICLSWNKNEDGTYGDVECHDSDEEGSIFIDEIPGETQFRMTLHKEGYLDALGTLETLTNNVSWQGTLTKNADFELKSTQANVTIQPGTGHLVVEVVNSNMQPLPGYKLSLINSELIAKYTEDQSFNSNALGTSSDGTAFFFNVPPGEHVFDVDVIQSKDPVYCSASPWSWKSEFGYTLDTAASAITQVKVLCEDEPLDQTD